MKIAFVGPIFSGKTRTAIAIGEASRTPVLAFGNLVKEEVAEAVAKGEAIEKSRILHEMHTPELKYKWREILQVWGTEVRRRHYGENYWVNTMRNELSNYFSAIVDDCRFWNEYNMLRNFDFKFIRCLPKEGNTQLTALHESEQYWMEFPVDLTLNWEPVDIRVMNIFRSGIDL